MAGQCVRRPYRPPTPRPSSSLSAPPTPSPRTTASAPSSRDSRAHRSSTHSVAIRGNITACHAQAFSGTRQRRLIPGAGGFPTIFLSSSASTKPAHPMHVTVHELRFSDSYGQLHRHLKAFNICVGTHALRKCCRRRMARKSIHTGGQACDE